MGNKKNRILLILMIVLSFVGIIWQLFSYMGVGLCYKFDLEGIPFNPDNVLTFPSFITPEFASEESSE